MPVMLWPRLALIGAVLATVLWWSAAPANAQDNNSDCIVNVKLNSFRVLADYEDGLFDGQMEVKVVFSVGYDEFIVNRYYPSEETEKMKQGDSRQLENFIFSVPAEDVVRIEFVAVEVDSLPSVFGVDIDQALYFIGSALGDTGVVGETIGGVIESGANALRGAFSGEDVISDDVILLYADNWWNAGDNVSYQSADGNFELSYRVLVTNCNPDDVASLPIVPFADRPLGIS